MADSGFDFAGKKAFVFITSGGAPARSLWHLSQAVTKTGAKVIGGIQLRGCSSFPTLFGLFPGRPDEKDLERAENFGHALAASIMKGESLAPHYKVEPERGGIFYDKVGPILKIYQKENHSRAYQRF